MGQNSGGEPTQRGTGQQAQQQAQGQPNQQPANGQQAQQNGQPQQGQDAGEEVASWFTETFLRAAVALFGVALLLLALGQMVGVNLLSIVGDFLSSGVGAWLVIAFFAMLLVVAASKSWNFTQH